MKVFKAVLRGAGTLLCLCSSVKAADLFPRNELRFGILQHDTNSKLGHRFEKGQDLNGEILFASPDLFSAVFSPRPHLGANLNLHGATNQFYAGFTWRLDPLPSTFIEFSLGGEIHNGKTKGRPNKKVQKKQNFGSRLLFRESISLGMTFFASHSLSLILEHASNARLAKPNSGLTGLGVRYGYCL